MRVKVIFFASLREQAGIKDLEIELPESVLVRDLKERLREALPTIQAFLGSVLVSINGEFAFDDDLIPDQAEIGLFPPVSGGAKDKFPTFVGLSDQEIDINTLVRQVSGITTGAVCTFIGVVRGLTKKESSHQTLYLEYEAYRSMAEAKMRQIAEEIRARWPEIEGIAIIQRLGRMFPGTPTVAIVCSAAHRESGIFDATHYAINRLKEIVPVWKKEFGPEGEQWIEGEYIPDRND